MGTYAARRALGAIPLLLGVVTLIFFVTDLLPGDAADLYVQPGMTDEVREQIRSNFGLEGPVHVRYGRWLSRFAQGDFGQSFARGRPVRDVVLELLPNTLLLAGVALGLAFALGILLGVVQASRPRSAMDAGLSLASLFFYSMPSFWLALMLVLVFSLGASVWGWPIAFPASGVVSVDHDYMSLAGRLVDRMRHLTLPAVSLALVLAAGIARYVRASMLEVIDEDYVRTARAKGLAERAVLFRHALRNALLPVVTLFGLYLPFLFSGTIFVESVFSWPGMGEMMYLAITQRDTPVIMAGAVIFSVVVVLGNLLADLLYAVADPRVRHA
jgi:peptide/nickel transport system permease protein